MTDPDFDRSVRATLADAARHTVPPAGLDERLIANARAGRPVVTPLRRSRRPAGWTLPLLAAATIVVVAGGAFGVTQLADQSDRPGPPAVSTAPVTHGPSEVPTASTQPTPTRAPTPEHTRLPSSRAHVPNPGGSSPPPHLTAAPADFRAATVSFRDQQNGVALGVGDCRSVAATSCKVTLIATDDGGATWHILGVPAGLRSMLNPDDPSCTTNGGVLGPCVDRVLFADEQNGYLFGLHEFYWTTDGGQVWQHAPAPAADSSGVPTENNVPTMAVAAGYAYRMFAPHGSSSGGAGRLQRAALGTNDWTDISPVDAGIYNSRIAATGDALYFEAGYYAGHDGTELYRSTDRGAHWTRIAPAATDLEALAVAPDGAVAASTSDCRLYIAADGHAFTMRRLPGSCEVGETYLAGMSAGSAVTVVMDPLSPGPRRVQVYHSSDGGVSYLPVRTVTTSSLRRPTIRIIGDFGYLALVGDDRVYLTFDGGQSWQSRPFAN